MSRLFSLSHSLLLHFNVNPYLRIRSTKVPAPFVMWSSDWMKGLADIDKLNRWQQNAVLCAFIQTNSSRHYRKTHSTTRSCTRSSSGNHNVFPWNELKLCMHSITVCQFAELLFPFQLHIFLLKKFMYVFFIIREWRWRGNGMKWQEMEMVYSVSSISLWRTQKWLTFHVLLTLFLSIDPTIFKNLISSKFDEK